MKKKKNNNSRKVIKQGDKMQPQQKDTAQNTISVAEINDGAVITAALKPKRKMYKKVPMIRCN